MCSLVNICNVRCIIENDTKPIFRIEENINLPNSKDNQFVNYLTVDYVDLYETMTVRHSRYRVTEEKSLGHILEHQLLNKNGKNRSWENKS